MINILPFVLFCAFILLEIIVVSKGYTKCNPETDQGIYIANMHIGGCQKRQ